MRATIIHGPGDIRVEDRDYPTVQLPTDAVVKVVASCVCGSDLWPYRGVKPTRRPSAIGHEFIGVVENTGADVTALKAGDFVIAPFVVSCGECPQCLNGVTVACPAGRLGWPGRLRSKDRRRPGRGRPGAPGRIHPGQGAAGRRA